MPVSSSFSQTKKVSKTENMSLYAFSIAVVDKANSRQANILNNVTLQVHNIYIIFSQKLMQSWHPKGLGKWNRPNLSLLDMISSIS